MDNTEAARRGSRIAHISQAELIINGRGAAAVSNNYDCVPARDGKRDRTKIACDVGNRPESLVRRRNQFPESLAARGAEAVQGTPLARDTIETIHFGLELSAQ